MSVRLPRPAATLCHTTLRSCIRPQLSCSRRTFLTADQSSTSPQILTAARTLPYPTLDVYDIIADIESYPKFIPYCTSASISTWSKEDAHYKRKWPQEAALTIGYGDGGLNESFTSRISCVPPIQEGGRAGIGIVEAISGEAVSTVNKQHASHHDHRGSSVRDQVHEGPLATLRTQWSVRSFPYKPGPEDGTAAHEAKQEPTPHPEELTDVNLRIEYRFKNPMYDMMSKAVASKVAETVVGAFEERVKSVLGHRQASKQPDLGASPETRPGHTSGKAVDSVKHGG